MNTKNVKLLKVIVLVAILLDANLVIQHILYNQEIVYIVDLIVNHVYYLHHVLIV